MTLESVCSRISSGGTPSRKNAEYFTTNDSAGNLWVKSKELLDRSIGDTEEKITDEGFNNSSAKFFPVNSVLIAMYGANVGQLGWLRKPATVNQAICGLVVDETKANWRFVFYSLLQNRGDLTVQAHGAAQQNLNQDLIRQFSITIPPLPIQSRIAGVLSAYDDLIENNLRRIRILEEMARALYREWFVDFRFPGHETVPLTDSHLGPIPQGWEVRKISDLLAKVARQKKIKTQDYLPSGVLPVIDQGRELVGGYTDDTDAEYSGDLPVIVFGDHTRLLKFIDFPFACGADGTQLLRSSDERMPVSLFYYALSTIELSNYAYARHFKFLKDELVVVPAANVATSFAELIDPMRKQIRIMQQQSGNLRRTRDLLLPRLLSGQVNLTEAAG